MADDLPAFLRQWDRPRYLAMLLTPEAARADVLALYAFHAELARVPLVVSEPQIGEIRLQWWMDTLDALGKSEAQDHPAAAALAAAVARRGLPLQPLMDMAEAHQRLLYAGRPESIDELEEHLGKTQSALIQLAALTLEPRAAPAAAEAAGLAGVALGTADIVAEPQRFANLVPKGWDGARLAEHGLKRLAEARAVSVPRGVFPAFLPVALAEAQLRRPGRKPGALAQQWRLWRAAHKKKF